MYLLGRSIPLVGVAVLLGYTVPAGAQLTFRFEGAFTTGSTFTRACSVSGNLCVIDADCPSGETCAASLTISVGDPFTLEYTFDETTIAADPPPSGLYLNAITGVALQIGATPVLTGPPLPGGGILVDPTAGVYNVQFGIGPFGLVDLVIPVPLPDDTLPVGLGSIMFELSSFRLMGFAGEISGEGTIDTFSVLPQGSDVCTCTGTIVGSVFCQTNGSEITNPTNLTVVAHRVGETAVAGFVTVSDCGWYSITGLTPGSYTIDLSGEGATCDPTTVEVPVSCEAVSVASLCACDVVPDCTLEVAKTCQVVPPTSTGADCQGKVLSMTFEYTGDDCSETTNDQSGKVECSGDPNEAADLSVVVRKDANAVTVTPSISFNDGDNITFQATGDHLKSSIGFDVADASGVQQSLRIHTSCSKPLNVGDQFGSMRLIELTSTDGGTVTVPVPQAPGVSCTVKGTAVSCGTGGRKGSKPDTLTWRYTGGGCMASSHNQPAGKASCSGAVDGTVPATVVPYKGSSFMVSQGELFKVKRKDSKAIELSNTGGTEANEIHVSCSQPLRVGDVYGSLTLAAMDGVGLGQQVSYVYEITNTSGADLTGVTVEDDVLGTVPGGPIDIPANQTVTLVAAAFVESTTTSSVTVTGQSEGATCQATASTTVTVEPPPPPPLAPFMCDKPIDELTMIWDGTQTIRVIAYKGPVGSEVLTSNPNDWNTISPGDTVTVSGFAGSPNDVLWEIFVAGPDVDGSPGVPSGSKLGQSTFHLSCSDSEMNGPEDCGKREGNGKNDDSTLINDWILEGMIDDSATLDCSAP